MKASIKIKLLVTLVTIFAVESANARGGHPIIAQPPVLKPSVPPTPSTLPTTPPTQITQTIISTPQLIQQAQNNYERAQADERAAYLAQINAKTPAQEKAAAKKVGQADSELQDALFRLQILEGKEPISPGSLPITSPVPTAQPVPSPVISPQIAQAQANYAQARANEQAAVEAELHAKTPAQQRTAAEKVIQDQNAVIAAANKLNVLEVAEKIFP